MADIYNPRTMIKMVEQLPPLHTFILSTFFRHAKTFFTETVEFDVKKGGMAMAPFVHPRIGSKVLERQGYKTMTYKPPLVAPKRVLTTDDLDTRLPGEAQVNGYNPNKRQAELLMDDMVELDNAITRREEWMATMALFNAEIPVVGEGIDEVISFDFDNNTAVDVPWSDLVSSRPLNDLFAAQELVGQSGHTAQVAIGDAESMRNLVRNEEIKKLLDNKRYDMGVIAPEHLTNGAIYMGYLAEVNLHLYAYNAKYADNDNENPDYPGVMPEDRGFKPKVHTLVPRGKVMVAPLNLPTSMLYGVVKDIQIGSHAKKRVPKKWDQEEPSERYLKISSRPLPCPKDLDTWATLDVL